MTNLEMEQIIKAIPFQELVDKATNQGSVIGQIGLAEFILKSYNGEINLRLKTFLQKVLDKGYAEVAQNVGKPAEDVALTVSKIMEKVG